MSLGLKMPRQWCHLQASGSTRVLRLGAEQESKRPTPQVSASVSPRQPDMVRIQFAAKLAVMQRGAGALSVNGRTR